MYLCTRDLLGNVKERDYSKDLGLGGRTILILILSKEKGRVWSGFIWLRIEEMAVPGKHGNKYSLSIKCKGLIEQQHGCGP